jgi:hypothetical protein
MASKYHNFDTYRLENGHLRLDVLRTAGPRIAQLFPTGSEENLLAELPDMEIKNDWGTYRILGGHRLWHAPEASPRSYAPDDKGLELEEVSGGVILKGALEPQTGMRKSMKVSLVPGKAEAVIEHHIQNENVWPVELAPWAITQVKLGGKAILPLRQTETASGLLPDRHLVVWPYTQLGDDRLHLTDRWVEIDGRPKDWACKVGTFNRLGWLAYWIGEHLFVKHFEVIEGNFVDFKCNNEVYVMNAFLEVETLGRLEVLQPGGSLVHRETWEVKHLPKASQSVEAIWAMLNA